MTPQGILGLVFTGQLFYLSPKQQYQSTEGLTAPYNSESTLGTLQCFSWTAVKIVTVSLPSNTISVQSVTGIEKVPIAFWGQWFYRDRLHTLSIRRQSIFKSLRTFSLLVDNRSEQSTLTRVRTLKLLGLDKISFDSLTARSSCGASSWHFTTHTDMPLTSLWNNSKDFLRFLLHFKILTHKIWNTIITITSKPEE